MKKKNIAILIVLFLVVIFGLYFGFQKKFTSKKEISILNDKIEVNSDQEGEKTIENQDESQPVKNEPQESVNDQKVETKQPASSSPLESPAQKNESVEQKKPAADNPQSAKIVQRLISWGFQKSSDRKIDTIILHSSYDAIGKDPYSISGIIDEYKQYEVSAHYLIGRDGTIYQLVADQNIAWHAGVAEMPDGRTNVNSFSIGIEMVNTQDGKYTADQYAAVNRLISDLKNKYSIKYVLGHNDIAPGRKTDPWGIDWGKINK